MTKTSSAGQSGHRAPQRRGHESASPSTLIRRLARQSGWALLLVLGSLALGVAGFHFWGRQAWIDALVNAAMLLGGMGPVGDLGPPAGKLFAAGYALYAGLVFLIVAGVLFAPVLHWLLHRFRVETTGDAEEDRQNPRE